MAQTASSSYSELQTSAEKSTTTPGSVPMTKTSEFLSPQSQTVITSTVITSVLLSSTASVTPSDINIQSTTSEADVDSTETVPSVIDICSHTDVAVDQGVYLVSPGKAAQVNYPVNVHCQIQLDSKPNQVSTYT